MLAHCKDDKPKGAEISLFQADLDLSFNPFGYNAILGLSPKKLYKKTHIMSIENTKKEEKTLLFFSGLLAYFK